MHISFIFSKTTLPIHFTFTKAICDATMELSTAAFSAHWTRSSSVGDTSPKYSKVSPNDDSRCESLDSSFDSYRSANQSNTSKRNL